jgi:hypothetical protein
MKYLLPLTLFSVIAVSCANDEPANPTTNGIILNKVYTSSYIESDTVRLFTKQGEVLDSEVKADYMQRHNQLGQLTGNPNHPYRNNIDINEVQVNIQFEKDSAIVQTNFVPIVTPTTKYSYNVVNEFITFRSPDTLSVSNVFVLDFIPDIILHNAYSEIVSDPQRDGKHLYKSLDEYYSYTISENRLRTPLLYISWNLKDYSFTGAPLPTINEFDEQSYHNLNEGDTVLLRQAYLILE